MLKFTNKQIQKAFDSVIKIRNERGKLYGDGWMAVPIDREIWLMNEKLGRTISLHERSKTVKSKKSDESMEDTLIDLINYALFALVKVQNKK